MADKPLTLQQQTRIAVSLIIEDVSGMLTMFVQFMINWHRLLNRLWCKFAHIIRETVQMLVDVTEAIEFTFRVFSIVLSALAFGLGIRS